ncbi:MAG TPA: tetratricopeptide repeat protein [Methylomirabilota bacterium]|nr:tetratricopeptide repeat protein [Methylomirabilota bacterium]
MAPRAARRSAPALAFALAGLLAATLLVLGGPLVPFLRHPLCTALALTRLDRVSPSCGDVARARVALAAGRAAAERNALRDALGHYRAAVAAAPGVAAAHAARGETAEMLGEYDEALAAFERAAALSPSVEASLRVGATADRLGRTELAVRALESAYEPWRHHALAGARASAAALLACAPAYSTNPGTLWTTCVAAARDVYTRAFEASREAVPRWVFRILVEEGQRERALAFARERGWLRDDVEYCGRHALPIDDETSALLAMLVQPERADCALRIAVRVADDGAARLGRLMLLDRISHSTRGDTRDGASYYLRYRLPAHDVPRVAEALNVTGWRLQHVYESPDEALGVFQKAIEADPRFSWPHHNIGRIYMARGDYEQARVWLERALAVNPDHWRALYNYGVTNANLERWPEALAAYRKALVISPNDAKLHANVGWTLIRLGQEAEAERELTIAVRLDPSLKAERNYLDAR